MLAASSGSYQAAPRGNPGVVTGDHGGAEDVIADLADRDLERLKLVDRLPAQDQGQGLKLLDDLDGRISDLDPGTAADTRYPAASRRTARASGDDRRSEVPDGLGCRIALAGAGDYDLMTTDSPRSNAPQLDRLRLGESAALPITTTSRAGAGAAARRPTESWPTLIA